MIKLFQAFPILIAAGLISAVFQVLANRNRTDAGKARKLTPFYWRGRENFTETGWRYRTYAMVLAYVAILSIVIPRLYAKFL
jgi:hypothetical protein